MRIIVDMQGLQTPASAQRGVGRYTENLVKALLRNSEDDEVFLALNGVFPSSFDAIKATFEPLLPSDRIVAWQQFYDTASSSGAHPSAVDLAERTREHFLNSFEPHVIFAPNLQEGLHDAAVTSVRKVCSSAVYVSTLHDVVPLIHGDYLRDHATRQWYFEKIQAAKDSDLLVTVSDASKHDIVNRLHVSSADVLVVKNGYDAALFHKPASTLSTHILLRYGIERPYLFYLGGADRHKNLVRLIKAFHRIPKSLRDGICLVMGGEGVANAFELRALARELGLGGSIVFPGRIADGDLATLYASCIAFVFPSMHEGFGLPVLEAMACGAPVLGSSTPAIAELVDLPKARFDPNDVQSMAETLTHFLSDPSFQRELTQRSDEVANGYSWDVAARTLIFGMRRAVQTRVVPVLRTSNTGAVDQLVEQCLAWPPNAREFAALSIAESLTVGPRTLFIDVSTIAGFDHKTGIQRVTRAIAGVLLNDPHTQFHVQLVYSAGDGKTFKNANQYMWSAFGALRPAEDDVSALRAKDVLLFLDLHPGVAIGHREHVQYLRNKGVRVYHVVYDILPIERPDTFWPELCAEFRLWAETVGRSDGALCISQAVATQLTAFLSSYGEQRKTAFRVGYFHLGADIHNSAPSFGMPDDAVDVLSRIGARPTILMVGTVEPRKAHRQAVKAFQLLWQDNVDVNLVIVGKMGWGMEGFAFELRRLANSNERILWLNGISDEYLTKIYEASSGLLAASEGEGFGLPLIEAARNGVDIIARDIPVFREVAGDHAWYFRDAKEPQVIARAVSNWLTLKNAGAAPSSAGLRWLSWVQSGEQVMSFIDGGRTSAHVRGAGNVCPGSVYDLNSSKLSWSGFSEPVADYRWTAAEEARLTFLWSEETDAGQLRLRSSLPSGYWPEFHLNDLPILGACSQIDGSVVLFNLTNLRLGRNVIVVRPRRRVTTEDAGVLREDSPPDDDGSWPQVGVQALQITCLPVLELNVSIDHRSSNCAWEGFSAVEERFRWTNGRRSAIFFRLATEYRGITLSLRYTSLGKQRVIISVNGAQVYDEKLSGSDRALQCALPLLERGFNRIEFELPDARRPDDVDLRLLALAVSSFQLLFQR